MFNVQRLAATKPKRRRVDVRCSKTAIDPIRPILSRRSSAKTDGAHQRLLVVRHSLAPLDFRPEPADIVQAINDNSREQSTGQRRSLAKARPWLRFEPLPLANLPRPGQMEQLRPPIYSRSAGHRGGRDCLGISYPSFLARKTLASPHRFRFALAAGPGPLERSYYRPRRKITPINLGSLAGSLLMSLASLPSAVTF